MLKSSATIILLAVSLAHCQYFYNYEEEKPDEPLLETQAYDPSTYQYNPPAAANQQYVQPSNDQPENSMQTGRSRTRIRVRSRNYPTENHDEANTEVQSEMDRRTLRQERKQERKRQRQSVSNYDGPIQTPRVYSPSVFEKIGLGEAPNGIFVPHDSLLNVLKNPSRIQTPPYSYQPPMSMASQTNNYIQPAVSYVSNEPRYRFFGQPPLEDTRHQNLPVAEPQRPSRQARGDNAQSHQARSVDSNRRTRNRSRAQSRNIPEPTVDIDSYRDGVRTDDIERKEIQVMPSVEYTPVTASQESPPTQSRRRTVTRTQFSSTPRVYSPSIFENVALGEAPNGIYVPEDSLLNVLRSPSARRSEIYQTRRHSPSPTYNQPDAQDDYFPETFEEEQYQPPLPPVRPSSRRQSSQRSRHSGITRQPEHHSHQNEPQEEIADQPVQPSSQRRSQQRNVNSQDLARQSRTRQTQTQRQQQTAVAPRPQSQVSSSRGQTFKEAKLALAELPLDTDDDGIPGEAGADYPTLHQIPKTTFACSQQSHSGYYADLETSCQVVHLCQAGGVKNSFLCPNGTIFSQEKFSCQWWYKVNCSDAPKFYIKNDELYKVPAKPERKRN